VEHGWQSVDFVVVGWVWRNVSYKHPVSGEGVQARKESSLARYDSLTVWRGVACLMVVIYHSIFTGYARTVPAEGSLVFEVLRKGWLGVPLFCHQRLLRHGFG